MELVRQLIRKVRRLKMNIIKNFLPEDIPCDTKQYFDKDNPSVITIHWIGPYPSQSPDDVRNWWIKSNGEASAHYIIKNDICMQCWPDNKIAWHAGCKVGNHNSIGIEVIPCDEAGRFSDKSINTLKALLDTFPKMPIVRHFDWTGKDCPKFYCNSDEWNKLLKRLGR